MNGGSSRPGVRRHAPLVLIACLWAARATALIPPETINRIVALQIQKSEIEARRQSGEIDRRGARDLFRPLDAELKGLYRELSVLSREERREADNQIDVLLNVRLATLKPQWDARGAKFQQQQEQRDRVVTDAMMRDVRIAVEVQRQRLLLQQRRDRGDISAAEFAGQDKRAVDQIMAMRGRYAAEGDKYAARFDREVKNKTAAMAGNPARRGSAEDAHPPSRSPAPATPPAQGVSPDVQLPQALIDRAVELRAQVEENILVSFTKEIDHDTMMSRNKVLNAEILRLDAQIESLPETQRLAVERRIKELAKERNIALQADYKAGKIHDRADLRQTVADLAAAQQAELRAYRLKTAWDIGRVLTVPVAVVALYFLLGYLHKRRGKTGPRHFWRYAAIPLIIGLWATGTNYLPNGHIAGASIAALLVPALKILAIVAGVYLLLKLFRRQPVAPRTVSTIHGSAHYAPFQADVQEPRDFVRGVFLGKSSAPNRAEAPLETPGAPICSARENHVLIVARTRTGKGTRVIVPTLLRYMGSALVIDPKGENAAITGRVRRDQLGQKVHVVNPWDILQQPYQDRGFSPATYNPLDILDPGDPNCVGIAMSLASAISPVTPMDQFWQSSAANVLTAVLLWLAYAPGEQKTLERARHVIALSRKEFIRDVIAPMMTTSAFSHAISEFAAPYYDMPEETYGGIMANLNDSMKFLSDPQVKKATATSSFSMEDLLSRRTTVYVVIPTQRMSAQKTWLRLVIASAMHVFKNRRTETTSNHRCLFMIDEFAALGRLDDIPSDIATMSGFGVDFALVVQGLNQLKSNYGDEHATILNNCAYKWFCNVSDLESAEYLSKSLGQTTVETTSTSESVSSGGHSSSHSLSTSHGETGTLLLRAENALTAGKEVAFCIQPNGHPLYLKPIDYWNMPEAFTALKPKYPKLYWDPPLGFDPNPYFSTGWGRPQRSGAPGNGHTELPAYVRIQPAANRKRTTAGFKPGYVMAAERAARRVVRRLQKPPPSPREVERRTILATVLNKIKKPPQT